MGSSEQDGAPTDSVIGHGSDVPVVWALVPEFKSYSSLEHSTKSPLMEYWVLANT
jgi:hypothetical protein